MVEKKHKKMTLHLLHIYVTSTKLMLFTYMCMYTFIPMYLKLVSVYLKKSTK